MLRTICRPCAAMPGYKTSYCFGTFAADVDTSELSHRECDLRTLISVSPASPLLHPTQEATSVLKS